MSLFQLNLGDIITMEKLPGEAFVLTAYEVDASTGSMTCRLDELNRHVEGKYAVQDNNQPPQDSATS